jgi:hypothetical protein
MRRLILAAAFSAFAPLAVAQTYAPATAPMAAPGVTAAMPATGGTVRPIPPTMSSGGSDNCGTPDEPKACPPMPRRALNYYPANK